MQIQIYNKQNKELVAWLYIDCDEDKVVDIVLHKDYDVKVGKNLKVREEDV